MVPIIISDVINDVINCDKLPFVAVIECIIWYHPRRFDYARNRQVELSMSGMSLASGAFDCVQSRSA